MPPLQARVSFLPHSIFGDKLRELREAAPGEKGQPPGWTTRKLSLISGVPEDLIVRIETQNVPPSWQVACRLADVFKVKLEAFR